MGMFTRDKLYGNRLDQLVRAGEPFLILWADVPGTTISTALGEAELARLVVARIDGPGRLAGEPIMCNSIAGAIVDKAREATPDEFPAVVEVRIVDSKRSANGKAAAIQYLHGWRHAIPSWSDLAAEMELPAQVRAQLPGAGGGVSQPPLPAPPASAAAQGTAPPPAGPLAQPCPTCGAVVGQPCRTQSGAPADKPHAARLAEPAPASGQTGIDDDIPF